MFTKILIANRGEIACRVIRTAKLMGIRTVAVYSDADRKARHVSLADEAIHIGASPSNESYLRSDRIIAAALKTQAQAIHPGYGFLSENPEFAQNCADNNIVFIGPPIAAIKAMGSKSAAKTIMENAKVPLVPGYHGDDQDPALLKKSANNMGYPVLLKAVAGGGGKGMRQVWNEDEFAQALSEAKRESLASFGNDDMLVEKYLTQPRHVEVQVFCDQHHNAVYLFERDCSVQRRHQKIIEEAPAPNLPDGLREKMGASAVRAAQAIDYQGAGTVEFLLDADGSFFFMEMNTRLQVEHPVTELITGEDLVEWQLRVANGEHLPKQQNELSINGHAFEARIYAEDPDNDFLPTTGSLDYLNLPAQNQYVRVDTGVVQGDDVSPYYDPMIAKLIVWDIDRDRALSRLTNALCKYHISGVTTNLQFLYDLANCKAFVDADLDTGFIEKHHDAILGNKNEPTPEQFALAGLYCVLEAKQTAYTHTIKANLAQSPWNAVNAWRVNQRNTHDVSIVLGEQTQLLNIEELTNDQFTVSINDKSYVATGTLDNKSLTVTLDGHRQYATVTENADGYIMFLESSSFEFSQFQADFGFDETQSNQGDLCAPMNGTVVDVMVNAGDTVNKGDALLIMEAMKMQHTIVAPQDGQVTEIFYTTGDLVDGGAELLSFQASISSSPD